MHFHHHPARFLAVSTLLALAPAASLLAQANLVINNPSFEVPALQDGVTSVGIQNSPNASVLNSWIVVGNTTVAPLGTPVSEIILTSNPTDDQYRGTSLNSPFGPNPLDGVQVASFRTGLLTLAGSATQVSDVLLSLNTRFTLTIGVGNPLDSVFQGYVISLLAGGTTLATATDVVNGTSVPDGTFRDVTANFILDPLNPALSNLVGTALTVSLAVPGVPLGSLVTNYGTDFDNVRLTASPIPEPGTVTSMGLGLLGLVGVQYARRRRSASVRA